MLRCHSLFAPLITAAAMLLPWAGAQTIDAARLRGFAPLAEPASGAASQDKIALGRMLYFEARLSKDATVSCNTCHPLARYGADGQPTSAGYKGMRGNRNSPTVYNAGEHIAQFWDGRAGTLAEQAKGPVLNPVEMALPSGAAAVAIVKGIPEYVGAFQRAFPGERDPVTFDNMAAAIGAFESNLVTPSRWDRFLRGEQNALTPAEKSGFIAFTDAGCQACHSGALLGGMQFQKLGIAKPYPGLSDIGRYKVTRRDSDRFVFKVPSLRNVEMTGPYFHDGKVSTLDEAVARMAEYQTGRPLDNAQKLSIVVWLKSLTGELPADYIKPPALPGKTAAAPQHRGLFVAENSDLARIQGVRR